MTYMAHAITRIILTQQRLRGGAQLSFAEDDSREKTASGDEHFNASERKGAKLLRFPSTLLLVTCRKSEHPSDALP
eukprot:CAMPEP_0174366572 /NCGR_PEP_ID=MMETSP0811_2-20130205/81710_1 /TAXON_ID=73025 ORGANISM="Eutreptiella gymnastica-like, Strain CCMP1594" /NCGR_SAMPLE_ID=MMETSP0811_2 /ASSEMBLY_ACC=CAM_ASM_000667 /LENGTH=75 /DNA_ID=CAMNT_0015508267 /DNA_START=95 /DNA_END=318 /DNA_ORIENTATION=-